jgi:5-deoxy-glucuronate isomerase
MGKPALHLRTQQRHGLQTIVAAHDSVMSFVSMDMLSLEDGERWELGENARELGVVILDGSANVAWEGAASRRLDARSDPFSGWPHALYVPAGARVSLLANGRLNAVIFGTPAEPGGKPLAISPDDVEVLKIGNGNWYLEGTFIVGDRVPSKRLIVGETHIPAGNWSSSPPHSHDKDEPGKQTRLEEIYYFRFRPSQGFGFQGLYTLDGEMDEAYIIRDGSVILVPKGMHPNVAGPGYEMYMLWGMAGTTKEWIPLEDPAHNWIGSVRG